MGLLKKVCRWCMAKNSSGFGWDQIDDMLWVDQKEVNCPYTAGDEFLSIKQIPSFCPYALEHIILKQKRDSLASS